MMLEVKTEGSPGLCGAGPLPTSPDSLGLLTFASAVLRPPFFPGPFLSSQPRHCFLQEDQPPWQSQFHHHAPGAPCSAALKTFKNCYKMVNMLFSRVLGEKEKKKNYYFRFISVIIWSISVSCSCLEASWGQEGVWFVDFFIVFSLLCLQCPA